MPCFYYNDNSLTFPSIMRPRVHVFYRHICSSCFAQNGKIGAHSAQDCKSKHSNDDYLWTWSIGLHVSLIMSRNIVYLTSNLLLDMCIIVLFVETLYRPPEGCGVVQH